MFLMSSIPAVKQGASASACKIKSSKEKVLAADCNDYNIIINFKITKEVTEGCFCCPICDKKVNLLNNLKRKLGFSFELEIKCSACDWTHSFKSSKEIQHSDKSINGVVTKVSKENGKCIDTAVFSKHCEGTEI